MRAVKINNPLPCQVKVVVKVKRNMFYFGWDFVHEIDEIWILERQVTAADEIAARRRPIILTPCFDVMDQDFPQQRAFVANMFLKGRNLFMVYS